MNSDQTLKLEIFRELLRLEGATADTAAEQTDAVVARLFPQKNDLLEAARAFVVAYRKATRNDPAPPLASEAERLEWVVSSCMRQR